MAVIVLIVFLISYLFIALENNIKINKAASALIGGVLCWTLYIVSEPDKQRVVSSLSSHLGELSQVLFFLLGAMTIVELIDAHNGFDIITTRITTKKKSKLIWIIGLLSFFLSAVLDNLTTTIVMVSLVKKLVTDKNDRLMLVGLIIIGANAGGAFSPIGDVTTTMLWIGGRISATSIVKELVIPSFICLLIPILILQFLLKGEFKSSQKSPEKVTTGLTRFNRNLVFFSGIIALLLVPVFKTITHLPPVMAMILALGILWIIVEVLYRGKEEARKNYSVSNVLRRIDTPSILFFLGILLAVAALESMGQLKTMAAGLDTTLKNPNLIVLSIGLLSSIVDNVPLVAASMGMYDLSQYPKDHYFWEFLAYCTGTGGSALIIGSAAGVAAMGIETISFTWYLKRISWIALAGYFAGAFVYLAMEGLFK
jgi:Na+/H+ antiporter NhaD/arsenite permease-like protein